MKKSSFRISNRIKQAAKLLLETHDTVAEISQKTGYNSQSKFTASFKEFFEITPIEYRKKYS